MFLLSRNALLLSIHAAAWLSMSVQTEEIAFRKLEEVWDVQDYVHLVMDINFSPVVSQCQAIFKTMHNLDETLRRNTDMGKTAMHPPSTKAIREYANQVCAVTTHWAARPKRQVLEFAAGSIFGAILASVGIAKLNSRINSVDARLRRGIVVLGNHETRMGKLEHDMNVTNSRILWEIFFVDSLMGHMTNIQDLSLHLQSLGSHTAAISRAWDALNSGRLSWDLLAMEQWHLVVARATAEANRMGGRLPVEDPMEILQFPVSFQIDGDEWRVIVHLPVIVRDVKLFQHIPQPMLIGNNNNNTSSPDQYVQLKSSKDLLLISNDNSLHMETSRDQLTSACHKVGTRLMCENLGVYLRQLEDTCLGCLYTHATTAALQRCQVQPVTQDWSATYVPPDIVVVLSKRGRGVDTLCQNGTRVPHRVKGVRAFRLDSGCALSSEKFLIGRSSSVHVEVHLSTQVTWDPKELEEAWAQTQQDSKQHLEEATAVLTLKERSKSEQESVRADQDWLQSQMDPSTPHGWNLIVALLVTSGLLLLALLAGAMFLGWRYLRLRGHKDRPPTQQGRAGRSRAGTPRLHGRAEDPLYDGINSIGRISVNSAMSRSAR
jgi:hypothetical protein